MTQDTTRELAAMLADFERLARSMRKLIADVGANGPEPGSIARLSAAADAADRGAEFVRDKLRELGKDEGGQ